MTGQNVNCCGSFRVLLRVRLLYYIKHEIIGDLAARIAEGVHARLVIITIALTIQLVYRAFSGIILGLENGPATSSGIVLEQCC